MTHGKRTALPAARTAAPPGAWGGAPGPTAASAADNRLTEPSAPSPRATPGGLACAFLKVSMASFGGGLSAWARQVVVEEKRWLDEEEFLSALTLARLLPGPNQVNFAIYVGNRHRGLAGAAAALAGLVLVPLAILVALGIAYFRFHHEPGLQAMLRGVVAAATGMALSMGVKVGLPYLRRLDALAFAGCAFAGVSLLRWPLALVVLGLAPLAVAWFWPRGASIGDGGGRAAAGEAGGR